MKFKLLVDVILLEILIKSNKVEAQTAGCGGTYGGLSGIINSPNFPNEYPNSLNCTFYINMASGVSVNITFTSFATEICCDFLQVSCSVGSFKGSQRFYGNNLPPFLSIRSCSRLAIRFYTDSSTTDRGFSLTYNIGNGIVGGLSVKPVNVFVGGDATGNIVLSCTSAVSRSDTYPWWSFSQDGVLVRQITTSNCSLFTTASSTLYRSTPQRPSSVCSLTVFPTFLSSVVGLYTCTDSTLDSGSAVLLSLKPPVLTSAPDLSLPTTEVVQGDRFTVSCSMSPQQQPVPVGQALLNLHSLDFNVTSIASISHLVTAQPTVLSSFSCDVLMAGLPLGCATNQPQGFSTSFPDRQVLFWPDSQSMNITGASDGKMATNTALICYSPSYPPSTYQWTYGTSGNSSYGPAVLVQHSGTYICTAQNVIRGRTYAASKSIDVEIDVKDSFNTVGLIIGVVLGVAVLVLLVAVIVTCVCLFRKKEPSQVPKPQSTFATPRLDIQTSRSATPDVFATRIPVNPYSSQPEVEMAGYDNVGYSPGEYEKLQRRQNQNQRY